jgi:folate-dependent phosphoribosylglycinamide formyltransferase PurN
MPSRLAVLASGRGSNLQAIIDHFDNLSRERIAKVVLVASNRADSPALIRAATASIDIASFDAADDGSQLLELLRKFRIDLVVLAGYLKRIPPTVIREYAGRMLNIHPALLPAFGGEGMYGARVHEAVIASGAKETGVTVHLVDHDYDRAVAPSGGGIGYGGFTGGTRTERGARRLSARRRDGRHATTTRIENFCLICPLHYSPFPTKAA